MADQRRAEHLGIEGNGNGRPATARDLEQTLAAAEAQLGAGEEALSSLRARLRTQASTARAGTRRRDPGPPAWPGLEDPAGFEAALREHARQSASAGASWRELFGRDGWAKQICAARVNELVAQIRSDGHGRKEELARTINSCETRADAQMEEARVQDQRAGEIERVIETVDSEIKCKDDEERRLTPGRRSGRLLGKEAVAAGVATGLADGAAFVLTISGLGGALWLRVLVASAVVLALNACISATARAVADLWRANQSSRLIRMLVLGALLAEAVAAVLLLAGFVSTPEFLTSVGAACAFSATLTLGWWHYSTEGARLAYHRRKLQGKRASLEGARRASEHAATAARRELFEILGEHRRALSDLDLLPGRIAAQIEQQRATGETLLAVAAEGFSAGRCERIAAEKAKRREPTITARMERVIDETIEDILRTDETSI